MNKEQLLEKVRSGKLAIENDLNDNNVSDLEEVLSEIFPKDKAGISGSYRYYFGSTDTFWDCIDKTDLPTIKVREALQILK